MLQFTSREGTLAELTELTGAGSVTDDDECAAAERWLRR